MKAIILLLLMSTGCFTTWTGLQLSGYPGAPDESVREVRVPRPGVRERLVVVLTPQNTFECTGSQTGTDVVYKAGYRYGSTWKTSTAGMFIAEALIATYFALKIKDNPANALGAGYFALDAIGTAAIFFIPRKEIYKEELAPMSTTIRQACPDGVALVINGETYPINAAGSIGELGEVALDDWMRAPNGSMQVTFGGQQAPIGGTLRISSFDVPTGTLTQVALP